MIISDFRDKVKRNLKFLEKGGRILYEKFEELLIKYETTAYRVSKDTGITSSTFTDWKNGRSKPKTEKLKKIADYFNVPLEYFLED